MNLPRLRELVKAGQEGKIRPEELQELFAALPEVLERAEHPIFIIAKPGPEPIPSFDWDDYAGRFGY
jgi:hypothetical protein